jgi:putative oxidoreductase
MDNLKTYLAPIARLLMSSAFIWAGVGKLRDPGGTAKYFDSLHVPIPEVAVWVIIVVELIGGIALLVGFKARWAAAVLALFCLITAFAIHLPAGDYVNMVNFYKNLVMAGGLLYVVTYGAGGISFDGAKA